MLNFILNRDNVTHNVRYIMKQKNANVMAEMPMENALKMLQNQNVHASDLFDGYPVTADDVYFFAGEVEKPVEEAPKKPKKRIKDVVCE